jgi:O-antigen ligase
MELGLGLTQYLPLALYVVTILVLLLTLFYKIEIGIYYLILLLPLENLLHQLLQFPLGKDVFDVFLLAFFVKWFFNSVTSGERFLEKSSLNRIIFFLILYTFIMLWYGSYYVGIAWPVDPGDFRLQIWKTWVTMFLFFFIILNNIKSPKQINRLILVLTLAIFLVGLRTFQMSGSARSSAHFDYASRATGTLTTVNANGLGAFLAQYGLFLAAFILIDKNKWRRLAFAGTASLAFFSMLFTFSRAGYLATLVGILLFGILKKSKLVMGAMLIFLLTWNYILPNAVVIRVNMTFNKSGELDSSAALRLSLWEQAKSFFQQKPLTGMGFVTVPFLKLQSTSGLHGGYASSTHSGFLQVLAELGLIGLLLLMSQFYLGIRMGLKIYKESPDHFHKGIGLGFFVCIIAILVNNLTHEYWQYMTLMGFYWILLGVINRMWINLKDSDSSEEANLIPEKPQLRHRKLIKKRYANLSTA